MPHGNGNATKRLATDMKARATTLNPSQQEQRECALQASGTHCTWYFHLRRSAIWISLCPSTFVAARGPAPCVKAPDQPQQRPNDAPCLADIASTLLCVCGYFTARAALYSIKLVHLQHMKVLTEQVIVKPNTHNTSCRWPVAFREVSWVHGMGVDGWSMTMDLQRIIAKFGRSESIASHTTRKISL